MIRILACTAILAAALPAAAFDLQGHRGARGLAPENTLPGFAAALSLGVTTLELDVGLSADGRLVVSHDPLLQPHLARKDGAWIAAPGPAIWHSRIADLQAFDVGRLDPSSRYARGFPDQKPVDGTRLPLLQDVFALVRKAGNTDVRFNIETKLSPLKPDETASPGTMAAALVDAIRAAGLEQRTVIQSFDWRSLKEAARLAPEIPRACLTIEGTSFDNVQRGRPDASPWLAGLDADDFPQTPALVQAAGCGIWSPFHRNVTADLVAAAHQRSLQVVPWTVNDPDDMNRLIDLKVDGLISDYPDRLRAVLQTRGLPLPAPSPVRP